MLFSIGDLITLVAVLLILVVFRALDRNNRSLEKLKRFSGKIMENLSAFVEEKTGAIRDLVIDTIVPHELTLFRRLHDLFAAKAKTW